MDQKRKENLAFASKAVYYAPESASQSIGMPIYMSSSFQYDAESYQRVVEGERKAVNIYGRCGNPSEYAFEEQIAAIESADNCLATASGMAAIAITLFGLLKSGDHIVCDWTTYSSTHEMLDHRLTDYGITTTFVDTANIEAVAAAIQPNTKVLYFETIANPSMKVPAIPPLVELAHRHGVVVVCDNTFASPWLIRPLEWGVDIVVESATKFIGGHNDAIGGTISMKSKLLPADFLEQFAGTRWSNGAHRCRRLTPGCCCAGANAGRADGRVCRTAMTLARHFESHPKVRRVWYPGLESHPQHDVALSRFQFGG
ncbi:MAG: aminotransferase class I/II-fold pyridoxal phosphate-dependent enzyme [Ardenticatenaceae bacterium]|nr:aminotransferase class I/II-fold pyridoxal phosphate-dependent enzyme [Ardenticatenaceae bacterium]